MLDMISADGLGPLVDEVVSGLRTDLLTWAGRVVDVHDELAVRYGRAVLTWAGIGLPASTAAEVSRCLGDRRRCRDLRHRLHTGLACPGEGQPLGARAGPERPCR